MLEGDTVKRIDIEGDIGIVISVDSQTLEAKVHFPRLGSRYDTLIPMEELERCTWPKETRAVSPEQKDLNLPAKSQQQLHQPQVQNRGKGILAQKNQEKGTTTQQPDVSIYGRLRQKRFPKVADNEDDYMFEDGDASIDEDNQSASDYDPGGKMRSAKNKKQVSEWEYTSSGRKSRKRKVAYPSSVNTRQNRKHKVARPERVRRRISEKKKKRDFRSLATQLEYIKEIRYNFAVPWIDRIMDYKSAIEKKEETEDIENSEQVEKAFENKDSATGSQQSPQADKADYAQVLVKFYGRSHYHNKWIPLDHALDERRYHGVSRTQNFLRQNKNLEDWKNGLTPEEIEMKLVSKELERTEIGKYSKAERIVTSQISATGEIEYMVKWQGLPYSECSWETSITVTQDFKTLLGDYQERKRIQEANSRTTIPNLKKIKMEPQPEWITSIGNSLREYQVDGVNWMLLNVSERKNMILADEMGLGKTIQVICFLAALAEGGARKLQPALVVAPLSALPAWKREFKKWAKFLNAVVYSGNQKSREMIRDYEWYRNHATSLPLEKGLGPKGKSDISLEIVLTTFEYVVRDRYKLQKVNWKYLVVDEAHRLKNPKSQLYKALNFIEIPVRVLVTGTPLQNDLGELWALLNFLKPKAFGTVENFIEKYKSVQGKSKEEGESTNSEEESKVLHALHQVLGPYLLRRIKKDVLKGLPEKIHRILHVEMTSLQKKFYKWILAKNFRALNETDKKERVGKLSTKAAVRTNLIHTLSDLKKCCNHCYLFPSGSLEAFKAIEKDANNKEDNKEDEQKTEGKGLQAILLGSGKLALLDKLLIRLKETGHRVLIFSQMVRMLDILSDYMALRKFAFQRLDGTMRSTDRQKALDHFNQPGSPDFAFILSTRAGGLGINLHTADTVIIFDSDWNPQNDLQAAARCHRIGQRNIVNTYRLVTKDTVEEEIVERAKNKMILDHLVIQRMDTSGKDRLKKNFSKESSHPSSASRGATSMKKSSLSVKELSRILKFGARRLFMKKSEKKSNKKSEKRTRRKKRGKTQKSKQELNKKERSGSEVEKKTMEITDKQSDEKEETVVNKQVSVEASLSPEAVLKGEDDKVVDTKVQSPTISVDVGSIGNVENATSKNFEDIKEKITAKGKLTASIPKANIATMDVEVENNLSKTEKGRPGEPRVILSSENMEAEDKSANANLKRRRDEDTLLKPSSSTASEIVVSSSEKISPPEKKQRVSSSLESSEEKEGSEMKVEDQKRSENKSWANNVEAETTEQISEPVNEDKVDEVENIEKNSKAKGEPKSEKKEEDAMMKQIDMVLQRKSRDAVSNKDADTKIREQGGKVAEEDQTSNTKASTSEVPKATEQFISEFAVSTFDALGPEPDSESDSELGKVDEGADGTFWEAIMPRELIPLDQLVDESAIAMQRPLLRSDRRKRAKISYKDGLKSSDILMDDENNDNKDNDSDYEMEDDTEDDEGAAKRQPPARKNETVVATGGKYSEFLTNREGKKGIGTTQIRQLYRMMVLTGDLSRAVMQIQNGQWKWRKLPDSAGFSLAEEILRACREAITRRDNIINEHRQYSLGNTKVLPSTRLDKRLLRGPVMTSVHGVNMDATKLLAGFEQIGVLTKLISELKDPLDFRLPEFQPKIHLPRWPSPRGLTWTIKQDAMMLVGVNFHGLGKWDQMISDKRLGLEPYLCYGPPANPNATATKKDLMEGENPNSIAQSKISNSAPLIRNRELSSSPKIQAPAKPSATSIHSDIESKNSPNASVNFITKSLSPSSKAVSPFKELSSHEPQSNPENALAIPSEDSKVSIDSSKSKIGNVDELKSTGQDANNNTKIKKIPNPMAGAPSPPASDVPLSQVPLGPRGKPLRAISSSLLRHRVLMLLKRLVQHERYSENSRQMKERANQRRHQILKKQRHKDSKQEKRAVDEHRYVSGYTHELGSIAFKNKRYREAIHIWSQVLLQNPRQFVVCYNRGAAHLFLREYDKALEDFRMALDIKPENRHCVDAIRRALLLKEHAIAKGRKETQGRQQVMSHGGETTAQGYTQSQWHSESSQGSEIRNRPTDLTGNPSGTDSRGQERKYTPGTVENEASQNRWWKVIRKGGLFIQKSMSLKSDRTGVVQFNQRIYGRSIGSRVHWIQFDKGFCVRRRKGEDFIVEADPPHYAKDTSIMASSSSSSMKLEQSNLPEKSSQDPKTPGDATSEEVKVIVTPVPSVKEESETASSSTAGAGAKLSKLMRNQSLEESPAKKLSSERSELLRELKSKCSQLIQTETEISTIRYNSSQMLEMQEDMQRIAMANTYLQNAINLLRECTNKEVVQDKLDETGKK
eukprot:CAMPEP_0167745682 /NCGR_PEP_ID=MMETSP0110_2-20121227/3288_1 /TAXON_ID=629695 /ORGANISM="Gymnochlora sp., Strain CCMP2014" /LENGTH=2323 /DNA_ID=CAMNT_0007630353 /DNA_START=280 /DNA_END=7251 /DNA_ORIENTATION=-